MEKIEKIRKELNTRATWQEQVETLRLNCKHFENCFVTDAVGNDFMNWIRGLFIALIGNTGSGKNYFLEHILIPYANKMHLRVLFVCNRIACSRQVKQSLLVELGFQEYLRYLTDEGLDELSDIGDFIKVTSYQKLANEFVLMPNKSYNYDIVILDECQWGGSDSSFVKTTQLVLNAIVTKFSNALRIYATATPDEILGEIIRLENYYHPIPLVSFNKPCIYEVRNNYQFVEKIYKIENYADILQNIIYSEDRWLLFINDLNEGQELRALLEKKGITTCFIHSTSKNVSKSNAEDIKYILKNKKFNSRVCIASRCIENGISIHDKKLKHIVIFSSNKTLFLQMLGRKRIMDADDCFTLYIQDIGTEKAEQHVKQNLKLYELINASRTRNVNVLDANANVLDAYENQQIPDYGVLDFYFKWCGVRCFNEIAYIHFLFEIDFYYSLYEEYEEGYDAYYRKVSDWLDITVKEDEVCVFLTEAKKQAIRNLCDYLEKYSDTVIKDESLEKFIETLKVLAVEAFGTEYKAKSYGVNNVRKLLTQHEIPYTLETIGKGNWSFHHI